MSQKFTKLSAMVNGKIRDVYLWPLREESEAPYPARTYVGSKVVSGRVSQNAKAQVVFVPLGKNASLV